MLDRRESTVCPSVAHAGFVYVAFSFVDIRTAWARTYIVTALSMGLELYGHRDQRTLGKLSADDYPNQRELV